MMAGARTLFLLLAAAVALLSGCAPSAPTLDVAAPSLGSGFPDAWYRQAQANGVKVLRIDPLRSLLAIEVRRGGALAALGHDHVVASHDVRGYVAPDQGRADLAIPLLRLSVDEPELRKQAGFETQPSAEAVDGTRRNMLDKVLEAERFPLALVRIERNAERGADPAMLRVTITLREVSREYQVPAKIEIVPDGMVVSGQMDFKQSDFGIVPFSVLGGALRVQDRLDLRFRIHAGP
jgi:hypothetical protein